jgi:RIO kinase 2
MTGCMQVEIGSKNHEVVPTSLITQISKLRSGGINKVLGSIAKRGLVSRVQNAKCSSPSATPNAGHLT